MTVHTYKAEIRQNPYPLVVSYYFVIFHENTTSNPLTYHALLVTTLNQHSLIILMRAVCITEVAEEVISSQVAEKFVIVHEPGIAELTQWVTSVAAVI